eukprot:1186536-Prorocentrum_minimum.AAC.6
MDSVPQSLIPQAGDFIPFGSGIAGEDRTANRIAKRFSDDGVGGDGGDGGGDGDDGGGSADYTTPYTFLWAFGLSALTGLAALLVWNYLRLNYKSWTDVLYSQLKPPLVAVSCVLALGEDN